MLGWLLSEFGCWGLRVEVWIPAILTVSVISGILIGARIDQ